VIRVLLVDDHKLVRTGIRLILEDTLDLRVAGEAESGEAALALAGELKPDVVLMDVPCRASAVWKPHAGCWHATPK